MRSTELRGMWTSLWITVLVVGLSTPAYAIRCQDWVRLNTNQRVALLQSSFQQILSSHRASDYQTLNKTRTLECLDRNLGGIIGDFDEQCAKGISAPVDILDRTLMNYVRSCAAS